MRDLKSEVCSAKLEPEPTDALRFTVLPLKNEDPRLIESDRERNRETCSTRLEAEPSMLASDLNSV